MTEDDEHPNVSIAFLEWLDMRAENMTLRADVVRLRSLLDLCLTAMTEPNMGGEIKRRVLIAAIRNQLK